VPRPAPARQTLWRGPTGGGLRPCGLRRRPPYRHVDSMLKHGLDRLAVPEASPQLTLTPVHAHLRGPAYYQ